MFSKAGKMREIAIIERPSATAGTLGQTQWETFAVVRAQLEGISGNEITNPQLGGTNTTHKFTIRYAPGIKATMRVRTERQPTRIFIVTHVVNLDGGLTELVLYCREVTTA